MLQLVICHLGGDLPGWIAFVVFVGLGILGIFFYNGVFDDKPKPIVCPPIKRGGSGGSRGSGGGGIKPPFDGTLPMCPDCPPQYILA